MSCLMGDSYGASVTTVSVPPADIVIPRDAETLSVTVGRVTVVLTIGVLSAQEVSRATARKT